MRDPRQQHGNHTWDLVLHYYACPACGYILENRDKFTRHSQQLEKTLVCSRCQYTFVVTKKLKSTFGPLLGHSPEVID